MQITSIHNPRIKEAAKLRDRGQRDRQQRIIIDGAREIARAITGKVSVREIFRCEALCISHAARDAYQNAEEAGAEIFDVTEEVLAKVAFGERNEGIVAVADRPLRSLADLCVPTDAVIGVLEGVEKPGNVGAVLRTADGAGVAAIIVADGRTDLFNPNAIRASLGTIFTIPVVEATSAAAHAWLREQGRTIYAARVDAARDYREVSLAMGAAIVLGNEAEGLSPAWTGDDVTGIHLPMRGSADSLNVSTTAAILFYEALRQRDALQRPARPTTK